MTTDAHADPADCQLSRGVSPGTGRTIWQCVNCSRWHVHTWTDAEPVCLRCGSDSREWIAALHLTEHGEFELGERLFYKLIRQANKEDPDENAKAAFPVS